SLGPRRQRDLVRDVVEAAPAVGPLGDQSAVVERVDEACRPQEAREAIWLVRPLREGHRVVTAPAGTWGEVDLAVLRPRGRTLGLVVETKAVASFGIDRVQERHPLCDGDFK